jgi:hypothetical protein
MVISAKAIYVYTFSLLGNYVMQNSPLRGSMAVNNTEMMMRMHSPKVVEIGRGTQVDSQPGFLEWVYRELIPFI